MLFSLVGVILPAAMEGWAAQWWTARRVASAAASGAELVEGLRLLVGPTEAAQSKLLHQLVDDGRFNPTQLPHVRSATAFEVEFGMGSSWRISAWIPAHYCSTAYIDYPSEGHSDVPDPKTVFASGWHFHCR